MDRHLFAAAVIAMAATTSAHAEFKLGGEVILGWGSAGVEDGAYGLGTLDGTYTTTFDNGWDLDGLLRLNLRSFQDEIDYLDDNHVDFRATLDMKEWGKLEAGSFKPWENRPFADGDWFNRGGFNVYMGTAPAYRDVFASKAARASDGTVYQVFPDAYLRYDNKLGPVGLTVTLDPLRRYGPFHADDMLDEQPWGDAKLEYGFGRNGIFLQGNNLGDLVLGARVVAGDFMLMGLRQMREGKWTWYRDQYLAFYNAPKGNALRLKSIGMGFSDMRNPYLHDHIGIFGLNFGTEQWELKFGADTQGGLALEGRYGVTEKLDLFAGWDNGYGYYEGFDDAYEPPVSVPERGGAFELAMRYRF